MCCSQMFLASHIPVEQASGVDSRLIMETRSQVVGRHLPVLIQQSLEVLHMFQTRIACKVSEIRVHPQYRNNLNLIQCKPLNEEWASAHT